MRRFVSFSAPWFSLLTLLLFVILFLVGESQPLTGDEWWLDYVNYGWVAMMFISIGLLYAYFLFRLPQNIKSNKLGFVSYGLLKYLILPILAPIAFMFPIAVFIVLYEVLI